MISKIVKAAFFLFSISFIVSCGEDAYYQDHDDKVRENAEHVKYCIQSGGEPFYTSNKYGEVEEWLGCKYPNP